MALFNDELVVGTDVRDLIPYLYDDDFIANARVEFDAAGLGISIRNAYLQFAAQSAELARRNLPGGTSFFSRAASCMSMNKVSASSG